MSLPAALQPLADAPDRAGMLVDYDGSLAPIVDHPEQARPLPAARRVLSSLATRLALVAVVSGRPVDFLRDALELDGVTCVGQYGLERLEGGRVVVDPRVERFTDAVAAAADAADREFPDLYVERKGRVAVTVHWRTAADHADAVTAWADATATRLGLAVSPTRMARELRPPVPVDKGVAVESLCIGLRAAAFAGDDHGDLAAFDALDRMQTDGRLQHTVRIGVHSPEEPPELIARAQLHVDGPAGLALLLRELAEAISPGPV